MIRHCKLTNVQLRKSADFNRRTLTRTTQERDWLKTPAAVMEELLDRRLEEESELRQLERAEAYESCCSVIDSHCHMKHEGGNAWFDLSAKNEYGGEAVDRAVRYLDLRGLIYRDPEMPGWISICDEDEPLTSTTDVAVRHVTALVPDSRLGVDAVAVPAAQALVVEPAQDIGGDDATTKGAVMVQGLHDGGHVDTSLAGHEPILGTAPVDAPTCTEAEATGTEVSA